MEPFSFPENRKFTVSHHKISRLWKSIVMEMKEEEEEDLPLEACARGKGLEETVFLGEKTEKGEEDDMIVAEEEELIRVSIEID